MKLIIVDFMNMHIQCGTKKIPHIRLQNEEIDRDLKVNLQK